MADAVHVWRGHEQAQHHRARQVMLAMLNSAVAFRITSNIRPATAGGARAATRRA